mmetsp:Transcript_21846/g.35163  ORF Transcript_21846/g.35163 Transcript_21846/m.35163 type:complete len:346 (-) Transcript_21846:1084-2121(-)
MLQNNCEQTSTPKGNFSTSLFLSEQMQASDTFAIMTRMTRSLATAGVELVGGNAAGYNHTATTRSQFKKKLLSLSDRNQELEDSLNVVERKCRALNEKSRLQELQIRELVGVIHSLQTKEDQNCSRSAALTDDANRQILVEKTRQIADLSLQVEQLKSRIQNQREVTALETDTVTVVRDEVSKSPKDAATNIKSSDDNSSIVDVMRAERDSYRQKCEALERSINTLKQKSAEREIRSAKNLRLMRRQIEMLEHERNQRQEWQDTLEQKISQLEQNNKCKQNQILLLNDQIQNRQTANKRDVDRSGVVILSSSLEMEDSSWTAAPLLLTLSQDDDTSLSTSSRTDS